MTLHHINQLSLLMPKQKKGALDFAGSLLAERRVRRRKDGRKWAKEGRKEGGKEGREGGDDKMERDERMS